MNKNKKWKETLNECRKNKNFMIGFVILVTVVLVAIFADVIAPYHYTEQNTGGRFVLRTGRKESEMPLNEEIIAGIVNESLTTVRLALRTYEQLGMIEAVDGVYVISDWDRIVDEERLRRLEARREAKRLEAAQPKKSREQVVHEYVAAHPDASQVQIARAVAGELEATGAEVIVTACPLCKKAIGRGTKGEVRDLAEIVAGALK